MTDHIYHKIIKVYDRLGDNRNIMAEKKKLFIAKTLNYEEKSISKNSDIFNGISNEASAQNRNRILKSYDYLLNNKYKVIVNEKTLDRVKNYFR